MPSGVPRGGGGDVIETVLSVINLRLESRSTGTSTAVK